MNARGLNECAEKSKAYSARRSTSSSIEDFLMKLDPKSFVREYGVYAQKVSRPSVDLVDFLHMNKSSGETFELKVSPIGQNEHYA